MKKLYLIILLVLAIIAIVAVILFFNYKNSNQDQAQLVPIEKYVLIDGSDVLIYEAVVKTIPKFNPQNSVFILHDKNSWLNQGPIQNINDYIIKPDTTRPGYWRATNATSLEFQLAQADNNLFDKTTFTRYALLYNWDSQKPRWRGVKGFVSDTRYNFWATPEEKQ